MKTSKCDQLEKGMVVNFVSNPSCYLENQKNYIVDHISKNKKFFSFKDAATGYSTSLKEWEINKSYFNIVK